MLHTAAVIDVIPLSKSCVVTTNSTHTFQPFHLQEKRYVVQVEWKFELSHIKPLFSFRFLSVASCYCSAVLCVCCVVWIKDYKKGVIQKEKGKANKIKRRGGNKGEG